MRGDIDRGISSTMAVSGAEIEVRGSIRSVWANLHGMSKLTRTRRFPRSRQKENVRALVGLFTFPGDETAQVMTAR
jgi:hypothetical protein